MQLGAHNTLEEISEAQKTAQLVCGVHFLDGKPTELNPHPQLQLGYERKVTRGRRAIVRVIQPSSNASTAPLSPEAREQDSEETASSACASAAVEPPASVEAPGCRSPHPSQQHEESDGAMELDAPRLQMQ
ncbi:hypothetical protein MTO96_048506 [Rhipicephalus appendiculatus]